MPDANPAFTAMRKAHPEWSKRQCLRALEEPEIEALNVSVALASPAPPIKRSAGRPRGSLNKVAPKVDKAVLRIWEKHKKRIIGSPLTPEEIDEGYAFFEGEPLDFMLMVMRDPLAEMSDRMEMAKAAAPYLHVKKDIEDADKTGKAGVQVLNIIQVHNDDSL